VESLEHLLGVYGVPGSNFDLETGGFRGFMVSLSPCKPTVL
jgi:hypothetical protein